MFLKYSIMLDIFTAFYTLSKHFYLYHFIWYIPLRQDRSCLFYVRWGNDSQKVWILSQGDIWLIGNLDLNPGLHLSLSQGSWVGLLISIIYIMWWLFIDIVIHYKLFKYRNLILDFSISQDSTQHLSFNRDVIDML